MRARTCDGPGWGSCGVHGLCDGVTAARVCLTAVYDTEFAPECSIPGEVRFLSLSLNKRPSRHGPVCPQPRCPDSAPAQAVLAQP